MHKRRVGGVCERTVIVGWLEPFGEESAEKMVARGVGEVGRS